jgi:hypothetical protein
MASTSGTRGIRNRNPGNLDHTEANKWVGELPVDPQIEKRFCRFDSPENGIRALCKTLLSYQRKHGLKNVSGIIKRWAPATENDTASYIRAVEALTGTRPGMDIDLGQRSIMKAFARAIIHHENAGYEYPAEVLDEGVRRALS